MSSQSSSSSPIFPPYLSEGSTGPAVTVLQVFLNGWLHNPHFNTIVPVTGRFDTQTSDAVKRLQTHLNTLPGSGGTNHLDVDGNFGVLTKFRIKEVYGVDVNEWKVGALDRQTIYFTPGSQEAFSWPPTVSTEEPKAGTHSAAIASY